MTKTQLGKYRHGVYGYPIEVELEAGVGEVQVVLSGVTAISLGLSFRLDTTGRLHAPSQQTYITRTLDVSTIIREGSVGIAPMVRWTVAKGDFALPGSYLMSLTFDFGLDQRYITEGLVVTE